MNRSLSLRSRAEPRAPTLLAACLVLTLAGCNNILGIEQAKVIPRDVDAGPAVCTEDVCSTPLCAQDEECPSDPRCVEGACQSPDRGLDADVNDGDGDAAVPIEGDGGDGGRGGEGGVCVENEFRCEGHGLSVRQQCVGGMWKSGASCEGGKLCDSQSTTPGECKPVLEVCLGREAGKAFCMGADRKVCGPDLVSVESTTCPSRDHCSMATGPTCAVCVMGEAKCEGDQLLVCNDTGTAFDAKQLCNAGECKANLMRCSALVCDPDAYTCSPDNKLLHCNPTGTDYLSMDACGSGVCDAAGKQCDMCRANEVLGCADTANQSVCAPDGQRAVSRTCLSIDAAKPACTGLGQCVGCVPLTNTCQNNTTLLSCSGQGINSPSTCTKTTCVGDRCTGDCAPGDQACAGTAMPARRVCGPEGKYVAGSDCEAGTLCDNATPGGQCRAIAPGCATHMPGEAVCNGVTRAVCGPDRVSLSSSTDCPTATHCQLGMGAACALCLDNEYKCVAAELQICNAAHTTFVSKKVCANEALCSVGAGDCTTQTCTPNDWYCNAGNLLQQCNETGTAFKAGTPCGSGICDKAGHQCDMCQPGTPLSCAPNGQLNRCSPDGQGVVPENCPTGTPVCTGAGVCRQCQPNVNTCASSTSINLCDGSGNKTTQPCLAHRTCSQGACRGVCAPGEFDCPQPASTARASCDQDGMFAATTACSSTQRCNTATDTCDNVVAGCSGKNPGDGVCVGGGNVRAVCGPDLVTYSGINTPCTDAAHCQQGTGGTCAFCVTNEYKCAGAQVQVCNGTHTGFINRTDIPNNGLCASATLCNANTGTCTTATCNASQWYCNPPPNGNSLQQCNGNSDGWASTQTCSGSKPICDATGTQCDACNKNSLLGCASSNAQSFCDSTGQGPAAPTPCPGAAPFCVGAGVCAVCQPDDYQCNSSGDLEKCSPGGSWGLNRDCTSTERCDKPSKTCINLAPFTLGRSDGGGAARPAATATVYAVPILVPEMVLLIELGVVMDPTSDHGVAEIALYQDSVVAGLHRPGSLIDGSDTQELTLPAASDPSRTRIGAARFANIQLQANTVYWAAVRVDELATENVVLVRHSTSGVTLPGGWVTTEVSASCGTNCGAMPTALATSGPSPVNNTQLAVFINVRRL